MCFIIIMLLNILYILAKINLGKTIIQNTINFEIIMLMHSAHAHLYAHANAHAAAPLRSAAPD